MKFAEGDKVVTDSIDIVTKSVVKYMIKSGRKLCTAESCTGGMISQTITSVSGASEMVPRRCLHLYGGNKDEASEREKGNAGAVYCLF